MYGAHDNYRFGIIVKNGPLIRSDAKSDFFPTTRVLPTIIGHLPHGETAGIVSFAKGKWKTLEMVSR